MATTAGSTCSRCGQQNVARAGPCGTCGNPLDLGAQSGPFAAPGTIPHPRTGDWSERPGETTRLLGATVHLDADLAESLIDEFLVEPRRCIPRSPGVDAASVLGDAAASHRRRQWRDGVLAILALVVLVAEPLFALAWLLVGAVVRAGSGPGDGRRSRAWTAVVMLVVLALLLLGILLVGPVRIYNRLLRTADAPSTVFALVPSINVTIVLAVLVVAAVIVGDRLLVAALVRNLFAPHRFHHEPLSDDGSLAVLRTMGRNRFRTPLQRTRAAEAHGASGGLADVVVFRGPDPFVGAGPVVERHAFVVPLEPEDGARPSAVREKELHDAISEGMSTLRRPSSLSPHRRLRDLRSHEQVLVSAGYLVANPGSDDGRMYLPGGTGSPPLARIAVEAARHGAEDPREWARYYRCHYVESWERDLTVSCYVTLGTDGHLLYLEWVTCALNPLEAAYRTVDDPHALRSSAWREGLLDVVRFPTSLPSRLRRVFRSFRPIRTAGNRLVPAQFGARVSLRELAASGSSGDYFHRSDVQRYASLFDRTVLEAVRTYLSAHGLKIANFDAVANSVINIESVNNSVFAAGAGARAEGSTSSSSASSGRGKA
ncbi:hypothetical protein [Actinomycetospora termitidis]|uniref:Uncharacterized protein n=1 Tax=Actinomycetospora termitidis TaxID=3053470 RepID=A0ABT7MED2_9PSEU|nr:hypothetical protein [Actinomycetospora sp. Odt1-22]MDL5159023.1 hypothetical protein [Actinomycetospora sp. Odt1-22]